MKRKKINISECISWEDIIKEENWTSEEQAEIDRGAMKILKRMELRELKELREQKGLSQKSLAEKAGLPILTVARIENNKNSNPAMRTLKKIANALNMDINLIFPYSYSDKMNLI